MKATQKVIGSRMQLSEPWLRTDVLAALDSFLMVNSLLAFPWYFTSFCDLHLQSITGVPNLFLTMYPFSIPTNEHVPLQHFNR